MLDILLNELRTLHLSENTVALISEVTQSHGVVDNLVFLRGGQLELRIDNVSYLPQVGNKSGSLGDFPLILQDFPISISHVRNRIPFVLSVFILLSSYRFTFNCADQKIYFRRGD
jgi:hypothetical protein